MFQAAFAVKLNPSRNTKFLPIINLFENKLSKKSLLNKYKPMAYYRNFTVFLVPTGYESPEKASPSLLIDNKNYINCGIWF